MRNPIPVKLQPIVDYHFEDGNLNIAFENDEDYRMIATEDQFKDYIENTQDWEAYERFDDSCGFDGPIWRTKYCDWSEARHEYYTIEYIQKFIASKLHSIQIMQLV